jgi:hypothetical protein
MFQGRRFQLYANQMIASAQAHNQDQDFDCGDIHSRAGILIDEYYASETSKDRKVQLLTQIWDLSSSWMNLRCNNAVGRILTPPSQRANSILPIPPAQPVNH